MALSDRQRHEAYEALAAAFADRTDIVIEMLRPATDLATTTDVDLVRRDLGTEIVAVRRDLSEEIAAVRRDLGEEIAAVRRDLSAEITSFRKEVAHEFVAVRHEMAAMEARLELSFEQRIHEAFATQTRTLMFGLVAAFLLTALTNVLTVVLG